MEYCKHNKVYSSFSYATDPPKTPWVCAHCGKQGLESPKLVENSYGALVKRFNLDKFS